MFRFLFGKKPEEAAETYDPAKEMPVLRCSICSGEQVAGFRNLETGKFTEVCAVRGDADLREFMRRYGLTDIKKEY